MKHGAHLKVLRNFTHKALEGELADKQLRALLVPTDLAERDGTRAEAMGLLDTAGGGGGSLTGCGLGGLGSELLAGRLTCMTRKAMLGDDDEC